MDNPLSSLLTALFADSFDVVKLKTQPPRNESNPLNAPFSFNDIKRGELSDNFSLATKSLRISNERKNILLDCSGKAAFVTIGDLDALESCDRAPSAIISVGGFYCGLWLLNDECDLETWQNLQAELAAKFKAKAIGEFVPLPSFDLVRLDGDNYQYEPIKLQFIDPQRRYKASELMNATITKATTENEPITEIQGCKPATNSRLQNVEIQGCKAAKVDAAKAFLTSNFGKAARLQSQKLIKAARLQNISERTLRTAKAALNIESVKTSDGWLWSSEGLPLAV